jgi:hypothetical protein
MESKQEVIETNITRIVVWALIYFFTIGMLITIGFFTVPDLKSNSEGVVEMW